ncbi:hypothetical protein U9M48_044636 [Paspalum notatum var. saurae]|uniref:Profilin n=1 Tax=Paspalum notatum var. saurae TaxID=547442 RepID=A0AAQ3UVG8_PASNO
MCEIEGHHLTSAAIVGRDSTVEEMASITKDFDKLGHLAPTGLFVGSTKYMVIRGEPGAVIHGKKGSSGGVTVGTPHRHLRRANDSRAVQPGGGKAGQLPD